MSAESGWVGTAIGIAVGMFAWVVGLGRVLWPAHPQWVLLLVIVVVSIVSAVILDWNDRRAAAHMQSGA